MPDIDNMEPGSTPKANEPAHVASDAPSIGELSADARAIVQEIRTLGRLVSNLIDAQIDAG